MPRRAGFDLAVSYMTLRSSCWRYVYMGHVAAAKVAMSGHAEVLAAEPRVQVRE